MKKVICFARVSTTQQDLEPQIEAVKKQIIADGYTEEQIIYVQGKESAIKLDEEQRQTLNEMKELVSDNPNVDSIYFFSVDRLARRMGIVINVVEWAISNGINMVFLNPHRMSIFRKNELGNKVQDDLTKLLLAMLSYGAEMEMKLKKARFETSKKAMKTQGKLPQGKPIKGYYLGTDKTILVNDSEAELIRSLYKDYLNKKDNDTLGSIHEKYVLKGLFQPLSTRFRSSAKARVYKMLTDVAYIGEPKKNVHKKDGVERITEITYPPIIDVDTFKEVQARLAEKRHLPKTNTKNIYYGKGIVRCGECGRVMQPVGIMCAYKCDEVKGHRLSLNLNVVDSIIWTNAKGLYGYYNMIDWSNAIKDYEMKIVETEKHIEIIKAEIEELYKTMDETNERIVYKRMRKEQGERIIDNCLSNITKLQIELTKDENNLSNYKRLLTNTENEDVINPRTLDSLNDEERVDIIKKVIDNVIIEKVKTNVYNIHVTPTDIVKSFNIDKTYYQYNSRLKTVTMFELYENGWVNGRKVNNEWVKSDVSWHLDNIRYVRKRYEKREC